VTAARIRGYTDRQSVLQGQSLCFRICDLKGAASVSLPIRIVRLGLVETELAAGLAEVHAGPVPAERGWENNRWPVSHTLSVGRDWPSGVYVARVGLKDTDAPGVYFVVRNASPADAAPIVVQIPTTTINAYNNWGGASLYGYNSRAGAARAVSFDRPQVSDPLWPRGYGFENEWELRIKALAHWLEAAGYPADFIADNDLHDTAGLLDPYRLFVSVGHDEYWTWEMRDQFDAFIARGANAAIFGGNTSYWQIRLEPDETTGAPHRLQVCHRSADLDPFADPARKTVTWREAGRPENLSFGAGFARGAWRGPGGFGTFKVCQPDHWVFAGTGLEKGDGFGDAGPEALLGYETDGVDYVLDASGVPVPTGADATPQSYKILALAELPDWGTPGNAALGLLTHPAPAGMVFNAATTDWAKGLETCLPPGELFATTTAKITRNVIERLAGVSSRGSNP
jgi:hypothetical protein